VSYSHLIGVFMFSLVAYLPTCLISNNVAAAKRAEEQAAKKAAAAEGTFIHCCNQ
jgi:hypothetical protein